jgi:hypothetical protein
LDYGHDQELYRLALYIQSLGAAWIPLWFHLSGLPAITALRALDLSIFMRARNALLPFDS